LSALVWYPATQGILEADWFLGAPADPLFRLGRSAENAPPAEGRRPLIVLSHGTGGSAAMLAWLGEALARAGYLVAAVNHHGNTSAEPVPTPEGFMLWWERATDVNRLLNRLEDDPQFGPLVDRGRIGAAGFSLGGYTVLAVAGARTSLEQWTAFCQSAARDSTCVAQPEFPDAITQFATIRNRDDIQTSLRHHGDSFRDARVRGVFAIAPVGSWLTEASLRDVGVPVWVVVGTRDTTAPAASNARRIAGLVPGARFSLVAGAGHYTFLAECQPLGRERRPDLCGDEPGLDRAAVHRSIAADAATFFGSLSGPQ